MHERLDAFGARCSPLAGGIISQLEEEYRMFNWALIFLVVAIIAGILGFSGIAGTATNIAWVLFVVGLIIAVVMFVMGRGKGGPTG